MKRLLLGSCLALATLTSFPTAQMRVVPLDEEQGHVALGLALRHLATTGIFMHTTAHPDDENNGLLAMLNRGQGYRTALATATRGNGGQNEIGPEIFEALGVLRTQELAAVHRFDGAEQYFTRAVDFGYSFSIEETFQKWGRDEITADYVRLMRMIRPDVVIGLMPAGSGGGQHHQASALITRDAVKLAGDPTKYPEQIKEGLRPWQPKKFYYSAGFGPPGEQTPGKTTRINLGVYDALLGKTYSQLGMEARSMHKCQGVAQLLSLPGPSTSTYQLVETTIPAQTQKDEMSLFDGVDASILGLAKFAGARVPKDLTQGLSVILTAVLTAQKVFESLNDEATRKPLLDGLYAVRVLRRELRSMSIDDAGRFEIDFRLRQKESEFQQAILIANGVKVEALGDDGVVVPGQQTKVAVIVANHGSADINVKQIRFRGFDGDVPCTLMAVTGGGGFGRGRGGAPAPPGPAISVLKKDQVGRCEPTLKVPATARTTEPYWHREGEAGRYTFDADTPFGLPFRPTPFYVQVTMALPGGDEIIDGLPVQHRYEGDIFSGEKRTELLVVPPFSLRMSPEIGIIPAASIRSARPEARAVPPAGRSGAQSGRGRSSDRPAVPQAGRGRSSGRPAAPAAAAPAAVVPAAGREIRVTVVNNTPGAAETVVHLEAPEGWSVTPPPQTITFSRQDEWLTVRFHVTPASDTASGEFHVRAITTANGEKFSRGFEVIEYPHVRRYHIFENADTTIKVTDVRLPANLTVGYVMGVGDQVPPAIEQLGAKVEMIGAEDLAWGNLSRFDVIVTGVRAYERRADLRANNSRLLEYVFNGGAVIVQYNKFELNDAQYGPYPAKVSSSRVTDAFAPVQVLAPHDPVFTTPNEIGEAAWKGWVQERGLYFLGEKDSRYRDLVELEDSFPNNKGPKTGALVAANYGKGRWVYVGLGLWRQLPEGVDGAYQLLANLLSLGKASR